MAVWRALDPRHRVQLVPNVLAVVSVWGQQPLRESIERHVVVAGCHDQRHVRELVDVTARILVLPDLGSLREIPGDHDHVRREGPSSLQKRLGRHRKVGLAEVNVRAVEDRDHDGSARRGRLARRRRSRSAR